MPENITERHKNLEASKDPVLQQALVLLNALRPAGTEIGENVLDALSDISIQHRVALLNRMEDPVARQEVEFRALMIRTLNPNGDIKGLSDLSLAQLCQLYKKNLESNRSSSTAPILEQPSSESKINKYDQIVSTSQGKELLLTRNYDLALAQAIRSPLVNGKAITPHIPLFIELFTGERFQVQSFPMGRVWTELREDENHIILEGGTPFSWKARWAIRKVVTDNEDIVFDRDKYMEQNGLV